MRITTEPFAETAAALRRVMPQVLDITLQRLRKEVPELQGRPRFYLQDALPAVLDRVAKVMAEGLPAVGLLADKAREHAVHREQQDLKLDQMLLEYQLLREAMPAALAGAMGRELTVDESARLHAAIDLSIREAAAIFVSQQRRRLESETEAMAKYLTFLSHDLRGNLNGAMLMIEVLRRDLQTDPRFAESIGDLDAMRQSMLDLVSTMDRFLQAERLRQGRVEVSLQTVDVAEFLHEQRRAIDRQNRGIEKRISVEVEGDGLRLMTDREMLTLVIQNMLSNCVKYGGNEPISLKASRAAGSGGVTDVCRIEVSDQGPGMTNELKERLFEPFVRGLDTGRPGTGLGLFIAKHAADLLGAKLEVQSALGSGTRFIIDLRDYQFQPASGGQP